MKPIRIRRRPSTTDVVSFKKDNQKEQQFFGETTQEPFFKPITANAQIAAVQRKCAGCEGEEKVQRISEKKEEKKVQLSADKKEEEKVMKKEEKKEEDKVQRMQDKKEEEKIQKKEAVSAAANSPATAVNYIGSINGKGQPMSADVQSFYESRMGANFSDVKIHTGKEAADSAKDIHAQAYAYGNNIVFNEGKYQPESSEGKRLLAHELVHVKQQGPQRIQRMPKDQQVAIPEESPAGAAVKSVTVQEELPPITLTGTGTSAANKIAYANCQGVSVQGRTEANYDHGSYSANSTSVTRASNCTGCTGDDCITSVGAIVSVFHANPTVTLPSVPSGLNRCEQTAVQSFIDTTLSQHEQQHVSAFNTYNATINTPFTYTGCRTGFDAYILGIHNGIEALRVESANALSNALDPFNPTIPCNCPDPVPSEPTPPDAGIKII